MCRVKMVLWGLIGLLALAGVPVRADTLGAKNGERLIGRVLKEAKDWVEFESATFGKLRVDRAAIVRLERGGAPTPAPPSPSGKAGGTPACRKERARAAGRVFPPA